eukprot:555024_1
MTEIYKPLKMNNYNIILLQYFNIKKQHVQNIQYLWIDSQTTASQFAKYILHDLYAVYTNLYDDISLEWCQEMLYTVNKMKQFGSCSNCQLFNFYDYDNSNSTYILRSSCDNLISQDFQIILFELNYKHPYFKANENNYNCLKTIPFCDNVITYVFDQEG